MCLGGNLYCHHCGKVLPECEEPEPYPWTMVESDIYCPDCMFEA